MIGTIKISQLPSAVALGGTESVIVNQVGNTRLTTVNDIVGLMTYVSSAGIATVAEGLTGIPNLNIGIVTATSYYGNGINLSGVVTSLVGYATESYVDNLVGISTFSGDYDDLTNKPTDIYIIACSDETTDLTTGTGKVTFRMPTAGTLSDLKATVTTAPVGANLEVDINENGSTILSTVLSIDDGEKTSETATTPAVISDSSLADDSEITIDIDQVGLTTAGSGLKVTLYVSRG